jgi:hypothetical protein
MFVAPVMLNFVILFSTRIFLRKIMEKNENIPY